MPFIKVEDVLAARDRVRCSVVVRFHEADLDRLRELVLAAPADHRLELLDQDDEIIQGVWTFETPVNHYVAVKQLLTRGGFQVVRFVPWIEPGAIFVASRGKVTPVLVGEADRERYQGRLAAGVAGEREFLVSRQTAGAAGASSRAPGAGRRRLAGSTGSAPSPTRPSTRRRSRGPTPHCPPCI
jgi:hypothetical protein